MATTPRPRPWRALLLLILAIVVGAGAMALSNTWKPNLGLDLVGGTSILLRADAPEGAPPSEAQMSEAVSIIRNRIGDIAEAEVTTQGQNHILVEVPGAGASETRKLVGQTAELRFRQVLGQVPVAAPTPTRTPQPTGQPTSAPTGTPTGQPTVAPTGEPTAKQPPSPEQTASSKNRSVSQALAAPESTPSATPTPSGTQSPSPSGGKDGQDESGGKDPATGKDEQPPRISTTPATAQQQVELQKFACSDYNRSADRPADLLYACDREEQSKFLLGPAIVLGTEVTDASAAIPQNRAGWVVQLELDGSGKRKVADSSTKMYQLQPPLNRFAIVLDGEVISAPNFQEPITGGQAMIEGSFTEQEANDLAQVLKYGALPLTFEEEEVAAVSPTLGSDQLQGGLLAGAIGLVLVVLYSFFYYRGLGIVVVLSLAIAAAMTYEAAVLLGVGQGFTLTLAGIAGLIVAIGITADSFVIYFERLRDEVREGKSLRTAVETSWIRARRTILAADSISLLAAVVLYLLSVGGVRSFAYALGLTTLVDVLVVFLFSKPLVTLLARTTFFGSGHRWSGLNPERLGVSRKRMAPQFANRTTSGSTTRHAIEEA